MLAVETAYFTIVPVNVRWAVQTYEWLYVQVTAAEPQPHKAQGCSPLLFQNHHGAFTSLPIAMETH
jgi:hypothetical protein